MKLAEIIREGTWALPNTGEKVKMLHSAFAKPLTPENAEELYHVLGDDDFMDIVTAAKKNGVTDVRLLVKDRALELLDISTWVKKPDEDTAFLIRLVKNFIMKL